MRPCAILLAAGFSRRFGTDKLLHPLADGTALGVAAARRLRAGLDPAWEIIAVLHPGQSDLAALLAAEHCRLVVADAACKGMGASLATGVAAGGRAAGWLVALADMPFIRADTHRQVAEALVAGAALAAPFHRGQRGHPVAFGADYRQELLALGGDQGARHILARDGQRLHRIETDDGGILADVDTPADLPAVATTLQPGSPRVPNSTGVLT